ncbi:hypothetical protein HDK90DRAFT_488508 [Phyllosticta capitalensis]|uniref:Secreted protein n=1 Tax=Phyllosticta capitalensis TaxID=121624 RepID=A0ABR1YNJ6_9PEZI
MAAFTHHILTAAFLILPPSFSIPALRRSSHAVKPQTKKSQPSQKAKILGDVALFLQVSTFSLRHHHCYHHRHPKANTASTAQKIAALCARRADGSFCVTHNGLSACPILCAYVHTMRRAATGRHM